jgi:hypothetical protein
MRLFVQLVVCVACVVTPSPAATAATAGSFELAQAGAHDDHHESPRAAAEQRTSPRATVRRRPGLRAVSGVRRAARSLRQHIGRWHQLPAAWRGPPVLLI